MTTAKREANVITLAAISFIDGKVVVVGKAEQITDHGRPCWLCSTMPPHKQYSEVVTYELEAIEWLKRECAAQEIFEGVYV